MNNHESRIHAMLANAGGSWPMDDEDRAAIQWLVDYSRKLKSDLNTEQGERFKAWEQIRQMREAAEKASAEFMRIAVR